MSVLLAPVRTGVKTLKVQVHSIDAHLSLDSQLVTLPEERVLILLRFCRYHVCLGPGLRGLRIDFSSVLWLQL